MLNRKEFGLTIKKARLEKRLTQEEVAEMLSITPIHIKQIEAGNRMPSVEVLYKIAITLNYSVDAAFFPENEDNKAMIYKIERLLRSCTPHDLCVIYATANALKEKPL